MRIIIAISAFLVLIFVSTAWFFGFKPEKQSSTSLTQAKTILILGADSLFPKKLKDWNGRSDFIAAVHIAPKADQKVKVSIISIPRDTYIDFRKYSFHKINSANQVGGYQLTKRAVKRLLKLEIDHVAVFSMQAIEDLVKQLGPMKIFVPKDMNYTDKSAGLYINLKAGFQNLDSKQMMQFLRYRDNKDGDIGRIKRQHMFFRALIKRLSEKDMIFRLIYILKNSGKAFLTDMSFKQMFELGILLRSLSEQSFQSYTLPGDFAQGGYWITKPEEINSMMRKVLNND